MEQKKAIIIDGIITNVIVMNGNTAITGLPLAAQVYDCTYYPVAIGDTFADGEFYHDGVEVERDMSYEELLAYKSAMEEALTE